MNCEKFSGFIIHLIQGKLEIHVVLTIDVQFTIVVVAVLVVSYDLSPSVEAFCGEFYGT